MGSYTAQILIGEPHPNHDGIIPSHMLFLSENSRPALILEKLPAKKDNKTEKSGIVWIPTLENMLDDAILMIAIHVLKKTEIIELANSFSNNLGKSSCELYEELSAEQLDKLYVVCRKLQAFPKLMISVFSGSHLNNCLKSINHYQMDVEVCTVKFSRLYSQWTGKSSVSGNLL
ncbi:MAG: hypothetical protein AB1403_14185 [Candidatus Riflebacteria bacterium]